MLLPTPPPQPLYSPPTEVSISTSTIHTLWGYDKDEEEAMIKILTCESGLRQFDNEGNAIVSKTSDKGIAQINQVWWNKAKELGYDLDKTVDNLNMGFYIWNIQGKKAWTCAKKLGVV